jgi:hypothetical protein
MCWLSLEVVSDCDAVRWLSLEVVSSCDAVRWLSLELVSNCDAVRWLSLELAGNDRREIQTHVTWKDTPFYLTEIKN